MPSAQEKFQYYKPLGLVFAGEFIAKPEDNYGHNSFLISLNDGHLKVQGRISTLYIILFI